MMKKRLLVAAALAVILLASWPVEPAVVVATPIVSTGVVLGTAQTGDADTTNTMDRTLALAGPTLLRVVSTVGAGPTVKIDIQGSMDGSVFFNVPYSLIATPETWVVTQITVTTATTNYYIVKGAVPWRYLKLVYSSNTNVTLTSTAFPTPF